MPPDDQWPAHPLDAARAAFGWLVTGPDPVTVNGRGFDYLPDRPIPVDELQRWLLDRGCPRAVWDQVWAHVLLRARAEGPTWTVVAVGLALPMLTQTAAALTARFADDPTDIHAEVLRGFLDAVRTLDIRRGRILIRLRWSAYRAGHRALVAALDYPTPKPPGFHSSQPQPPSGHPDLVLAQAAAVGVLTETEAGLIGDTRVEGIPLTDWAATRGLVYDSIRKVRRRAEHRLARWLADESALRSGSGPEPAATREPIHRTHGPAQTGSRAEPDRCGVSGRGQVSGLQGCERDASATADWGEIPRCA